MRTSYAYDATGRLTSLTYPGNQQVTLTYDPAGNIITMGTEDAQQTYEYDSLNRLLFTDGITFTYNTEGMLILAEDETGAWATDYDAAGRITKLSRAAHAFEVRYEYDEHHRLAKVSDTLANAHVSFAYDLDGRLTRITRSNGIDTGLTWDAAAHLTHIAHGDLAELGYDLNAVGRVVTARLNIPLQPADYLGALENIALAFDQDSRIDQEGYAYDDRGRLTRFPEADFVWDWADRLVQAGSTTLTYNGSGDLICRDEAGRSDTICLLIHPGNESRGNDVRPWP